MNNRRRILIGFLTGAVCFAVLSLALVLGSSNRDRDFNGKPESEWLMEVKYNDAKQAEEWRAYGDEGVQVLGRGLRNADRPGEKLYRQLHGQIPEFARRWLPWPRRDSTQETRERLVSLLRNLDSDAKGAIPVMIQVALHDESRPVRSGAIGYFIGSGPLLAQLTDVQKKALLPAFIRAIEDSVDNGMRHNAAIGMKYFRGDAERLTPVLRTALQDPDSYVRLYAADALNHLNPVVGKEVGATTLLVELMRSPNTQVASKAVPMLVNPGVQVELAPSLS